MMKAVSFMYVRPPGYNAESAKAAEIADEKKRSDQSNATQDPAAPSPPATYCDFFSFPFFFSLGSVCRCFYL